LAVIEVDDPTGEGLARAIEGALVPAKKVEQLGVARHRLAVNGGY